MFVRVKRNVSKGIPYEYLQIVRSYREGGKVRQQIIGSLGRRDRLVASGELDGLLKSLAGFSEKLRVVEAVRESGLAARTARQWGPALVFGRLWDRQGLPDLLRKLAQDRKFEFDLERATFAMAVGNKRYVVCRNPQEALKDAATREAILDKLRQTIEKQGAKAVIGNRGYARFLKVAKGSVSVDEAAVKRDARLDGKFVLTTNTDLPTAEVAQTYKSLWRVERTFREQKSTLEVRPIYHQRDDTSMGHIVASFLALRLEVDLQQRLEERETKVSWPDLMRDLGQVQSVLVELDGQRYQLRTDLGGAAHQAFVAAGVRPPPTVTPLGTLPESGPAGGGA